MAKTWVSQIASQIRKVGKQKASWYANWYDPNGKRCCKSFGSGSIGKQLAFRHCKQVERDIATGDYGKDDHQTWSSFIDHYKKVIIPSKSTSNKRLLLEAIHKFESRVKLDSMADITTFAIDQYISERLKDRGAKKGTTVAPQTVNKELRSLKSIVRIAYDWDLIAKVPKFHFLEEPEKIPRHVTSEHFGLMFNAAQKMEEPIIHGVNPESWWKAVLATCFLTGWRINEILLIHQSDLDFKSGILSARYQNEKRKRDDRVRVPDELLEVLRPVWKSDYPLKWPDHKRKLYRAYGHLQETAGIHLPCNEEHEHTKSCYTYGFHDLRRGFATINARTISADELQKLMKHRSYTTTKRYINMANRVQNEPSKVYIPDILKPKSN